MKINNILPLSLLVLSTITSAETITFKTQSILNQPNFSGDIPYIQGKNFDQVNQQIKKQLLVDDDTPINFNSENIKSLS